MAASLQIKYPLRPIKTVPRNQCTWLRHGRLTCLITSKTTPQPDRGKLVIVNVPNINGVGPPLSNDPTLQSTGTHKFWVAAGCTTVFASLAKSIIGCFDSHVWLEPVLAGYAGYILADLSSGVYHWMFDNYGDKSTPVIGSQIEEAKGHHKWPWTITRRQFANNLHVLAQGVTLTVLPLDLAVNDPVFHSFVSSFAFCVMFSQQFHAWAHGTKSKLPPIVVALQDMGLLVSRSQHAPHHLPPYNKGYCVVSGLWNKVLDDHKVFEAMEMMLYFKLGVRPRSWSEPNPELTEETKISNQAK